MDMREKATIRRPKHQAYTLIEVLVVVTIMGLAAAIVVPNMMQGGTLGIQAAARMIIADLLFAQNEAMAQQSLRRVSFDTDANRYAVEKFDNATGTWRLEFNPSQNSGDTENYEMDFDDDNRFNGVNIISADFGGRSAVEFDDLGNPSSGGTIRLRFEEHVYDIDVAPFTGRVTVERVPS